MMQLHAALLLAISSSVPCVIARVGGSVDDILSPGTLLGRQKRMKVRQGQAAGICLHRCQGL